MRQSREAQEAVLTEFYGSGVHHYFAGNMPQAIADLTVAVQGGTKDPRVITFVRWPNSAPGTRARPRST